MLPKPESACFLIADITGYTSYLAGVELDHAQDIIADLMNAVVRCLRPPFRLAKFEGDAAFVYAAGEKVDGSQLQDAIEAAYFAFRRRLRTIRHATSCTCAACRGMQDLDFKFVVHHGEFIRQRMGGREELAGRDVIVVHRLTKNGAAERLGGHAYALYSDACVRAMGIDTAAGGLVEHAEAIDIIGEVTCWLSDLDEAWRRESDRARTEVTGDKAAIVIAFDLAAPRQRVWEYFTVPDRRPKWRATEGVQETVAGGRRGAGTTNHCMHGDHVIVEEVIDWRPYDYLTLTTLLPMPGAPKILMTYAFTEIPGGGTHVEIRVAKPKPKDKAFLEQAGAGFRTMITSEMATLRGILESEHEVDDGEGMPPVAGRGPGHAGAAGQSIR